MSPTTGALGARHLVVLAAGLGLVLTATPVLGSVPREDDADQAAALILLEEAAWASRTLAYTGTQFVATWRPTSASSTLVEIRHEPGRGAMISVPPTAAAGGSAEPVLITPAALEARLLGVLGSRYDLRVAGDGHCTGRPAHVVEARRPGRSGPGSIAGRFWVDTATGLLLRREVFDGDGRRVRSSAFVDLSLPASAAPVLVAAAPAWDQASGEAVSDPTPADLRDDGWHVPGDLPGGFVLFDAWTQGEQGALVLHLSYSDGLSTTALFSQPGELGSTPPAGFAQRSVAGHPVWASSDGPERMVWAGGDQVWTLVSDAPGDTVARQLAALPREELPRDGLRTRLGRGFSRLVGMLNPLS